LVTAAVFAADRITKHVVDISIAVGEAVPSKDSFIKLFHILNDGVAFSMFQGHRTPLIVLQSALVVVIVAAMLIAYRRFGGARSPLTVMTAFSLMLGGGLGNLWDRVSTGLVTDFVSVGNFAVFNVADACLVAGCGLLILYMLRHTGRTEGGGDEPAAEGDGVKSGGDKPAAEGDGVESGGDEPATEDGGDERAGSGGDAA
jgi:signal peptidase II